MKRVLILATTPFAHDGLTKIEMDVYRYNLNKMDIEFASSFGFDNEYGYEIEKNGTVCNKLINKKKIWGYEKSIYQLIKNNDYDVVYIHGNSAMMFIEAFPVKLARCKCIITHCHNTKSDFPIFHYLLKPFLNLIVDKKVACSEMAAKWLYVGANQFVVLNGIDIDRFKYDLGKRESMRKQLGVEDYYLIGHVGRFSYQKNHKKIIDVFKECLKLEPKSKLILIGEGALKESIVNEVNMCGLSDKVIFVSSTNCVENYLQAMDCFLFPSFFEGLGIVALEAQANGLPIVLSEVCPNDVKLSPECRELSLEDTDLQWAMEVVDAIKKGHSADTSYLDEDKWSHDNMMSKISEILNE